jgi:hypothetical protein
MAQVDSENNTVMPVVQSRRRFLSQSAGMAAGGAVLALATIPPAPAIAAPASALDPANASPVSADPIFDLIEGHKKANAEYAAALSDAALDEGQLSPDPEKEEHYSQREDSARWDLATTVPTTLQGLLAVICYVEEMTEGKHSACGRPDQPFAEDDLMNLVITAGDCLRAHLAVAS